MTAPDGDPSGRDADDLGTDDTTTGDPLLAVEDLRTHVHTDDGTVRAADGVSFGVDRGETVCLVGESGSGKTVTCGSITGIVEQPPAEIVGGSARFDGRELLGADERTLRSVRGDRIAHVFQDPGRALDPVYTVGDQIAEAIEFGERSDAADGADPGSASDRDPRRRGIELLGRVGVPEPAERIDDYPHEFSRGMCQRAAIAVALAADPDLVIADEPTTALDVTVQARLLELFAELTADGTALLLVTHDMRVVAALADRVVVLYAGRVVERGPTTAVFDRPAHPYTQALFDGFRGGGADTAPPPRAALPETGCRFRTECPHAEPACADPVSFHPVGSGDGTDRADHEAACVYHAPDRDAGPVLDAALSLGRDRR